MDGFVRDGDYLRVRRDAVWPQRCVVCNRSEGVKPVRVQVSLASSRSGSLVRSFQQGAEGQQLRATLEPGFCPKHAVPVRYRLHLVAGMGLLGVCLILASGDAADALQIQLAFGGLAMFVAASSVFRMRSPLTVGELTKTHAWILPPKRFIEGFPRTAPAVVAEAEGTLARLLGDD